MTGFDARFGLAGPARSAFMSAATIFVYTIVIGILNGADIWEPEHDALMSHVHSGTLGWVTLGVAGVVLLMFSDGRQASDAERRRVAAMTYSLIGAIVLYVLAFLAGDSIFDDRIQRPIVGTALFVIVVWFLWWLVQQVRSSSGRFLGLSGSMAGGTIHTVPSSPSGTYAGTCHIVAS